MSKDIHEDWERFGRASKPSAPEIAEVNTQRNQPKTFDAASYYGQMLIHRAHVTMLAEEGIISHSEAKILLNGLMKVDKQAKSDPSLVSYMSTETALIKEIGEVGGRMHIGRSRNDLGHAQRRLFYRDQVERVMGYVIEFQQKLVETAERNIDTVMPGYTHWRQAQPTTLAHYLLAHAEAAYRTVDRLEDCYKRTNLSPLGSAAFAGTGWPVNRHRTAELLGFNDFILNSQDCVASIDYYVEFAAAIAIHMSNLSRLAEDIQIWSSDEFMLLDLDEAYAGTSSIMPQKKNPLILEYVKAYAAESLGALVSTAASMKGVSYTNTVDRVMLEPVAIDTAIGSTRIMGGVIETMNPIKENMAKRLSEGFTTTTDLADALVRAHTIGFRQAHDILVEVTLRCLREGKRAEEINGVMIREAAILVVGKPLDLSESEIKEATNPILNVKRRKVSGGPSPRSVREMIRVQKQRIKGEENRRSKRLDKIKNALRMLKEAEIAL
jgi:argininosuccinate lyase